MQYTSPDVFSHRVGSLFILMLCSLAMQKLFILIRSHLFILSFITIAPGDISVKTVLHGISENSLPLFFSSTLMVAQLIFKSFIHCEFSFVYAVSWCLSFIYFACGYPALPTPFAEYAIFTPFYAAAPLSNNN